MEEKKFIPVQYEGQLIEKLDLRDVPKGTYITGTAFMLYDGDKFTHPVHTFVDVPVEKVIARLDGRSFDYVELDQLPNIRKGPWGLSPQRSASLGRHRARGRKR